MTAMRTCSAEIVIRRWAALSRVYSSGNIHRSDITRSLTLTIPCVVGHVVRRFQSLSWCAPAADGLTTSVGRPVFAICTSCHDFRLFMNVAVPCFSIGCATMEDWFQTVFDEFALFDNDSRDTAAIGTFMTPSGGIVDKPR